MPDDAKLAERPESTDDSIDLARTTLRGDVRDHLLDFIKHNKDTLTWDMLPEARQWEIVERAEWAADQLVEGVAEIIAADGRVTVSWGIKKVELVKEGIKVVLVAPYADDAWLNLGKATRMTTCSVETQPYRGQRKPGDRHVTPDQGKLPVDPDDEGAQPAGDEGPVFDQTPTGKRGGKGKAKAKAKDDTPAAAAREMFGKGKAETSPAEEAVPLKPALDEIISKVKEFMADGAGMNDAIAQTAKVIPFIMNRPTIDLIVQAVGGDDDDPDFREVDEADPLPESDDLGDDEADEDQDDDLDGE